MEDVIWKPIEGYEDYLVSNTGLVKNKETDKILSSENLRSGYKSIALKGKSYKVHRLVAKAFVKNNDPLKDNVDHLDGNKMNNNATNLEWVTGAENTRRGYITGKNHVTKRSIQKLDGDGNVLEEFESLKDAKEKTGIDDGAISKVCKGTRQTAGGFKWKFSNENPNEIHNEQVDLSQFVPINGFPNYMISKEGKIYSIRFKKYMKTQINGDGYMQVSVANNNLKKTFLVHRLVAEHFIPKVEGKDLVNLIDGNKLNFNSSNLIWVGTSENNSSFSKLNKKQLLTKKDENVTDLNNNEIPVNDINLIIGSKDATYTLTNKKIKINKNNNKEVINEKVINGTKKNTTKVSNMKAINDKPKVNNKIKINNNRQKTSNS